MKQRKHLLLLTMLLFALLVVAACGSNTDAEQADELESKDGMITYESETGPIEVPANPQRVVALGFTGNILALDVNVVGVDTWSKNNPNYEQLLQDVTEVSEENLEQIMELDPDLIIAYSTVQNAEQLQEIAPTVLYTYNNLDYLEQHVEIGKLLNKEEEAQAWVDDFKARAEQAGEEIKEKVGEDATVSVIETFEDQLYVFGNNWGRGTEILYQTMGLAMPEKVEEMALADGYYALSFEALPEFAGDYIILSKNDEADNSFQETNTYQSIPAVQNGQVFEANAKEFYFNDPLSLELQLEFFKEHFLSE
ncbi:iron-hydroxamate ABC transporter substrate-binding protein [Halalkalibacterium halodurans]|uniref:iron-hydroxamate ABC transporter substrate-binding protein n=1 Tax=Halalkalibacterium halodurans TaxID=86665 RepID=UPI002AAA0E9A|nr:iron-hydroxamate ABC transporter substrate-binding protein [Halalkalibacterium halodurans]MDY7224393.1 iron-hydroxamate ABC transporter substrate-binding protein [Halalkalibacterium halodurans]MDY7243678.1 iron-hydroxamate ABC transporter substrate-binding protein [Halalkalibacterium halodurans]